MMPVKSCASAWQVGSVCLAQLLAIITALRAADSQSYSILQSPRELVKKKEGKKPMPEPHSTLSKLESPGIGILKIPSR